MVCHLSDHDPEFVYARFMERLDRLGTPDACGVVAAKADAA